MGDYTKLIVNAEIKAMTIEDFLAFEEKVIELRPKSTSAYHAEGECCLIKRAEHGYEGKKECTITAVAQGKYGNGIEEFLDFLEPYVTQGVGQNDAWAWHWSEYQKEPTTRYMREDVDIS